MELEINDKNKTKEWLHIIEDALNKTGTVTIRGSGRHIIKCISLAEVIKREAPIVTHNPQIYCTKSATKPVSNIKIELKCANKISMEHHPTLKPIKAM
jgi:hypothetical protein